MPWLPGMIMPWLREMILSGDDRVNLVTGDDGVALVTGDDVSHQMQLPSVGVLGFRTATCRLV